MRVHLQLARFMNDAERPDEANLARLAKLVRLAEETGLYLDVTGLGCYHKQDVPAWYDGLEESARWDVQARFWKAVAGVCKDSPAIFCYDLMNEPILTGGDDKKDWLPGKALGGKHFVQRITLDARGRTDKEIARAWVEKLTTAIRSVDDRHMITVGVIPWAQVFKGAKPLFYSPEVGGPLDFVSVHFYPKAGELEDVARRPEGVRGRQAAGDRGDLPARRRLRGDRGLHRAIADARRRLDQLLLGQDDRGVREGGRHQGCPGRRLVATLSLAVAVLARRRRKK